mmetsp:Transcript_55006/g.112383  ORF Transcript_55006/g.112383 Transcript_55006/m.112383 type:complete len:214 (+) Transcript_55006:646-1287(+)
MRLQCRRSLAQPQPQVVVGEVVEVQLPHSLPSPVPLPHWDLALFRPVMHLAAEGAEDGAVDETVPVAIVHDGPEDYLLPLFKLQLREMWPPADRASLQRIAAGGQAASQIRRLVALCARVDGRSAFERGAAGGPDLVRALDELLEQCLPLFCAGDLGDFEPAEDSKHGEGDAEGVDDGEGDAPVQDEPPFDCRAPNGVVMPHQFELDVAIQWM